MKKIFKFILVLVVMSDFITPTYGTTYFQDDFSTFTGWTYTATSTRTFCLK